MNYFQVLMHHVIPATLCSVYFLHIFKNHRGNNKKNVCSCPCTLSMIYRDKSHKADLLHLIHCILKAFSAAAFSRVKNLINWPAWWTRERLLMLSSLSLARPSTVSHNILLEKLTVHGLDRHVPRWVKNWLDGWDRAVVYGVESS